MKIKQIHITNFKSIVDARLDDLADFSVFAGANGSGKSNFFEALEFVSDVVRNGVLSFPRSAWECRPRRSASRK